MKLALVLCLLILSLPANAITATYYYNSFNSRKMANGQRFNQSRLGKTITVTNRKTGKSIRVKVTDRCRCSLDLSRSAFLALGGKLHQGRIPVRIR